MYQIAICDDDVKMRRFLRQTVSESGISCRVEEFASGADLLRNYGEYDILFLDIDMPGGNGIEVAERIRRADRRVKIIYVTGYQEYMGLSFIVHPFAFLLKPVQKEEIIRQMKEALVYGGEEEKGIPVRVRTTEGIEEIVISELYYLEYQNRKLRFVLKHREVMVRGKMTEYLERLGPYGFAAPHKSFIVNLYHVKAIRGYEIIMMNEDRIPLSQKRSVEFRAALGKYQADRLLTLPSYSLTVPKGGKMT